VLSDLSPIVAGVGSTVVRFRFRAYPGAEQTRALSRTFGSCRVVANDAIAARKAAYRAGLPYPTSNDLSRLLITQAKLGPDRAWLGEVSAVALQQSLADVDRAYSNFFDWLKGKRAGRKVGPPRFRSRHDSRQSARFTKNAKFTVEQTAKRDAVLTLPKIGPVRFVRSRPLPAGPSSVTVIREADGRTYVSFVVTVTDTPAPGTLRVCGIDPGLTTFATTLTVHADGTETVSKVQTPKFLRRRAKALARWQRSLSRKRKGRATGAKPRSRSR
jgi:putative transposase